MSVLSSFVPGRVRLRSSLISDPDARKILVRGLEALPFVTELTVNPATGSLLLFYRVKDLPLAKLKDALPLFDELKSLEDHPAGENRTAVLQELVDRIGTLLTSQ